MSRFGRVSKRIDPLTVRVRERLKTAMAAHLPQEMKQVELARRAGETQQSVQRFLSGQMPYPSMTFLDRLVRVFGWTLIDVLRDELPPPPKPPITDPRVLQIAELLQEAGNDVIVEAADVWVRVMTKSRASAGARGALGREPTMAMPSTRGKRGSPTRQP